MNYEQKYNDALDRAKKLMKTCDSTAVIGWCEHIFPELYESDDERIRKTLRKRIIRYDPNNEILIKEEGISQKQFLAWIDKQGKTTIWDKKDEQILNATISHIKNKTYKYWGGYTSEYVIQWLESLKNRYIWTPIEKQGEQNTNILWHDISEEPDEQREIFCEWKWNDGVWHDVVFYHADTKTFWNGEQQIENVIKWAYVDEMLEKQGETNIQNNKPFKIESDKFYFCIKDYFAGGCYRSKKGDVVLAQNGMNMMGLSPKEASEYFIPINPFKEHVVVDWFEKEREKPQGKSALEAINEKEGKEDI